MLALDSAQDLANLISSAQSLPALDDALSATANEMGFQYFALGRHPRSTDPDEAAMRLHNYPLEWAEAYDRRRLGLCDPVHRASHRVAQGFRWRDARNLVSMGERDERMLAEAREHDIDDGYTIPANIPGEPSGSITFATRIGRPFPDRMLLYAQGLGAMAYQQARLIVGSSRPSEKHVVTDRQAEVLVWIGRDKTDEEIALILGVSKSTVTKHVRDICGRFETYKRTSLPLRAVWEGILCFADIFD